MKTIEYTVGSTSEMLDKKGPKWAQKLLRRLRIPSHFLPPVTKPGTVLGPLLREIATEINIAPAATVPVLAVTAHDTASTVAAIPGMSPDSVFISSGTLSIMGAEIREPICTPQAFSLQFSNERGAEGSVLLLCNITGLGLLQECMRQWRLQGKSYTWTGLLRLAEKSAISQFDFSGLSGLCCPEQHALGDSEFLPAHKTTDTRYCGSICPLLY